MQPLDLDVAVIGGGPGGLAAAKAILTARWAAFGAAAAAVGSAPPAFHPLPPSQAMLLPFTTLCDLIGSHLAYNPSQPPLCAQAGPASGCV